jgi:hypothetical protein
MQQTNNIYTPKVGLVLLCGRISSRFYFIRANFTFSAVRAHAHTDLRDSG